MNQFVVGAEEIAGFEAPTSMELIADALAVETDQSQIRVECRVVVVLPLGLT